MQYLEQESNVDVECSVTVLLVEAACIFECYDEVLVHDEAKTSTGRTMETIVPCSVDELLVELVLVWS